MLRKLVTPVLLVLLSMNGSWMVCADGETMTNAESEDCLEICLARAQAAGVTCILLPGGESITTFSLGVAILPEAVTLSFIPSVSEIVVNLGATYRTPPLKIFTPPPKA